MDLQATSTETNRVLIDNIPIAMQNNDLEQFCSHFGKVNSITRSTSDKTCAVVEFEKTCLLDHNFYNCFQSVPFMPAYDLFDSFQNGQFLSNVLNSFNLLANTTDENRNVTNTSNSKIKDDSFDEGYLICTYCYCCAEFLCERCQSPYCSEKCQRLDWLLHKKNCSPKSRVQNNHVTNQDQYKVKQ